MWGHSHHWPLTSCSEVKQVVHSTFIPTSSRCPSGVRCALLGAGATTPSSMSSVSGPNDHFPSHLHLLLQTQHIALLMMRTVFSHYTIFSFLQLITLFIYHLYSMPSSSLLSHPPLLNALLISSLSPTSTQRPSHLFSLTHLYSTSCPSLLSHPPVISAYHNLISADTPSCTDSHKCAVCKHIPPR